MPSLPPRVGASLVKATRSQDLDEALSKVLTEYLSLKVKDLQQTIDRFEEKWGMSFDTFKQRLRQKRLPDEVDAYAYDTEQDFWQWEEAQTLKAHYERVQEDWA